VRITADTYGAWIQPESPGAADRFAERIAQASAHGEVIPFARRP
jgi:hypothetical protein